MRESQYLKSFETRGEQKGAVRARRATILEVLETRLGSPAPESIRLAIEGTNDLEMLRRWFRSSFAVSSWTEFEALMKRGEASPLSEVAELRCSPFPIIPKEVPVPAEVWKQRDVAAAFLNERSLLIPDRPRQLDVMLRILRFAPRPPRRVLDVGAGDALLLATVLEAFPEASGVAVDFSPLMLEQARERLAKFGPRASTIEADLGSPTWLNSVQGPFDAVISGFAIHHLPDERKRTLYREIRDLLHPGGVFLNAEHVSSSTPNVEKLFDDAMSEHLYQRRRERGEAVTREQVQQEFLVRPDRAANILAPLDEQCAWLRDLGFQDVDCFWKYFELAIFGGVR